MYLLNMLFIYKLISEVGASGMGMFQRILIIVAILNSWLVLSEFGLAMVCHTTNKYVSAYKNVTTYIEIVLLLVYIALVNIGLSK